LKRSTVVKKKNIRKALKKKREIVVVIERHIDAKDTLFPEKLAKANEILRNTKFRDSRLGL